MIRQADQHDVHTIAALACLLWPHHSPAEMEGEFSDLLADPQAAVFLKFVESAPVGFAQCQLRHDYVEGTDSSPVGYLEGIFVREEFRGRGFARELLHACESWARDRGCVEFASDCELDNMDSLRFHLKAGFMEANRIICFTKKLGDKT